MAPPRRGSLTIPPEVVGSRKNAPASGSLSVLGVGAFAATLSTSDALLKHSGHNPEPGHGGRDPGLGNKRRSGALTGGAMSAGAGV
jgi:hypothetical protein